MKILFVEDDALIASGLIYALEQEGYEVVHCSDVAGAKQALAEATGQDSGQRFALGLLDLSLPDGTGYELCRELRAQKVPVVFLTAVDDEANAVQGLEMGAEDYITKPFRLRELMARLKNVLRRAEGQNNSDTVIAIAPDIQIHTLQAKVTRGGEEVELTAMEYRLLLTFANNRGRVLTRAQLLENIWDVDGRFVSDNTLTVYVRRLREKLGDNEEPHILKTVRGMGYQLDG